MIDTHTHLYLPDFDDGEGQLAGGIAAVDRAVAAGVETMVFPNIDLDSIEPMQRLAAERPEVVRMAMGFHPTEVRPDTIDDCLSMIESELRTGRYVAVGEIGIDLYWDTSYAREQADAFDRQCAMAAALHLPVIVHCRSALEPTLEVLSGHKDVQAIMHSFGGTEADARRILDTGDYYFGINGIITFKNSKLARVIPMLPADRILLETDSPYLTPVPYRGRRCESAYVQYTCAALAAAMGISPEEADALTTANARRIFSL